MAIYHFSLKVVKAHANLKFDYIAREGKYSTGKKAEELASSIFALFKELEKDQPKERFTLGITDDVTGLSLPEVKPAPITAAAGTKECTCARLRRRQAHDRSASRRSRRHPAG